MRIRQKLIVGFLGVSLLVSITGFVAYRGVITMNEAFNDFKNDPVADIIDIYEIEVKGGEMLEATADYLLTGDPDELREFSEAKKEIYVFVEAYLARAKKEEEEAEIELGKKIKAQVKKLDRISSEIISIQTEILEIDEKVEQWEEDIEEFLDERREAGEDVDHIGVKIGEMTEAVVDYMLTSEKDELREYNEAKEELAELTLIPELKSLTDNFTELGDVLLSKQAVIIEHKKELEVFEEEFEELLDETREKFKEEFKIDEEHVGATVKTTLRNIIFTSVLVVFLGLFLGYVISLSISRPISRLKDAAVDIAQGNMDAKIQVEPGDEIGELAEAFDNMRSALKVVMEEYERREKKE